MEIRFKDRAEAGQILAKKLSAYKNTPNLLVLALPRGGVPVAYQVARGLNAPLEVFVVRKLGMPGHEELAMGAIASGGVRILNPNVVRDYQVSEADIRAVTSREQKELERREQKYRAGLPPLNVKDKTIILIDDGLATGSTMLAAITALKTMKPAELVIAVPTASEQICASFRPLVDEIVCVITPEPFYAVGLWYGDFSQTTDTEVQDLLSLARSTQMTSN